MDPASQILTMAAAKKMYHTTTFIGEKSSNNIQLWKFH